MPIGPVAEGWQIAGSPSADLRWLPMKSEATALRPPRVGLVDLSRAPLAAGHHGVHALPAEIRAESTRLSDDGSWAVLDLAGYRQCVLPLALPLLDCIVVPRNSKGEMLDVQFVRGQPPLAWRAGAPALRWQAGRFVPTLIARNLSALAWDNTGLWRAEAADGRGVTLRREHSGAVALRLPAAPAEVGTIERLFPFPGQGWVFASNGRGSLVAWNRDAAAGWQAPFVLDAETLREARGPYSVRLADADRTLVVDGLPIALDAERLLRETMRLASGRSVDPATRR